MLKYIPFIPFACLIVMAFLWRFQFVSKVMVYIFFAIINFCLCVFIILAPFIKIIPVFGDSWYWIVLYEIFGIFWFNQVIENICVAIDNYKQIKNKN